MISQKYKHNFSPNKILYLTFHPDIGGGETILLSLLTKLDRKKFDPIVVVTKKGQLSKALSKLKIKTYILNLSPYLIRKLFIPGLSPSSIYKFIKLTRRINPDLIHVNHLNLAFYAKAATLALKIIPGRHVPVIATAHGKWDCLYFYQDLVNQFCTDKVLANTEELSKTLIRRKILNLQKVTGCQFGVDTNYFMPLDKTTARKTLNLPQKNLIITIVGRLDPVKDHMTFLKSAKLVHEKLKNVTFYIVGSKLGDFTNSPRETGQSNSYEKQIKDYLSKNPALAAKVTFGSFIESMPSVYNATDILVSSSPRESFGLAIAEGGACALPIIATVGNTIVKNGRNGFLVKPQNPKAIAEKILTLAINPKLRKKFGENGRKLITRHFQLQDYVTRIENVYFELLKTTAHIRRRRKMNLLNSSSSHS